MRVLVVLAAVICACSAFNNPRVILFDGPADLVENRAQAMQMCISRGHCIAHDSQIVADLDDGYNGHHKCGFTWDSHDGKPRHAHCNERDPHNHEHCQQGKSELRNTRCTKQEKYGVYCRVERETEDLPHPCKIEDSDLTEVFRLEGPFYNVPQALAGCVAHGAELAYWSQVAAHVDRYDIAFCQYNILRVDYAVYQVNCHHEGRIKWRIRNNHGDGYGALCYGMRPHPFENPCSRQFPTMAGKSVYCDHQSWIIIQDRPPCDKEKNHFSNRRFSEYKNGFGALDPKSPEYGGYWLGLQPLHQICSEHVCRIRFEMFDKDDNFFYAEYDDFYLGDENDGIQPPQHYQLKLGNYVSRSTAGNALQDIEYGGVSEDGSFFSHEHRDGDQAPERNCAIEFNSGWWFASCHRGNLNGLCDNEVDYHPSLSKSRFWAPVNGGSKGGIGLKRTRIKIQVGDAYTDIDSSDSEAE